MSEQPHIFRCTACGAGYKWDARLAGRGVRCRCGQELLVPLAPPARPQPDTQDYDVGSSPASSPVPRARPAAALASPYIVPRTRTPTDDETATGPVRNYILPAIMLALGILIALSQVSWKEPDPPRPNTIFFGPMFVANLLAVLVMMFGAWLSSHVLDMNLGRPAIAVFKLAAICVFAVSSAIAVKRFDQDSWGAIGITTAFSAAMLIYWCGFGLLFKLEIHEVFLTSCAITLMQVFVAWAVLG